uniref:Uncharacterized protein n=1 Tax=Arundo donax TaxID=35708 RepID=A0A0A8ZZK6_ARUDO
MVLSTPIPVSACREMPSASATSSMSSSFSSSRRNTALPAHLWSGVYFSVQR